MHTLILVIRLYSDCTSTNLFFSYVILLVIGQLETRFTSRIEPGKTPGTRSEPRLEYQAMDVENRTNYVCVSVCPSSSKSHIPPVNNNNSKKKFRKVGVFKNNN